MTTASPRSCCFEVFTLFPAAIDGFVGAGLLGKAIEQGRVQVHGTDIREFATDRHRTVDDAPFGGGAGMVMTPGPVVDAMEHVAAQRGAFHRVLLTPSAPRFDQAAAARLAEHPRIGLLCGRYEGIDDRVREHYVDECLSLGDFVLNGGEVAALVIIEAISRLVAGVVGNPESVDADSFGRQGQAAVLEHPHYTRPAEFRGHAVPPVLLGGDHGAVARWRREAALQRTWDLRPDLRSPRRLPSQHPIYLVVPVEQEPHAAAIAAVARAHGVTGLMIAGASLDTLRPWLEATEGRVSVAAVADARQLRRRLRRGAEGSPRLVVVVDPHTLPPRARACGRAEHLLDVLDGADPGSGIGPLMLWMGDRNASGLPFHAIYAPQADDLTPQPTVAAVQGLAPRDGIAQSPDPRPRLAALADLALTGLRDSG